MQAGPRAGPPNLLQIYREPLKPGVEVAYDALEQEQARISAAFGCPHPYLGAESLSGPREVWWFNGYESPAEQQHVYDAYARNTALLEALQRNNKAKAELTLAPVEVFTRYRADSSSGVPWTVGQGRFLVITVTTSDRRIEGTVFEAPDGVRFVVQPARTRKDADAATALAGSEAVLLAVRPSWSFPDEMWIAADPLFWQEPPAAG
jgi:hypothetical protein